MFDMNFHFLLQVGFLYKQQIMKTYILKSGEMVLNDSESVSFLEMNYSYVLIESFASWDECLILWAVCKIAKQAFIQMKRLLLKSI